MDFINLLNETYVSWVASTGRYDAVSWTGEIREFDTWAEGNAWRIAGLVEAAV